MDMFTYEKKWQNAGKISIAGVDEAGRGPLAGAVCVACVIMPLDENEIIADVNDSKKLSEKKRDMLFDEIIKKAISFRVVFVDEKTIDKINILNATKLGMKKCIDGLSVKPDIVLIDAVKGVDVLVETEPIIKGDAKSYSIACASILAKVSRDRYMKEMAKKYPNYCFEIHKGYGTANHIKLLKEFGPCEIHRRSFIKNFVEVDDDE